MPRKRNLLTYRQLQFVKRLIEAGGVWSPLPGPWRSSYKEQDIRILRLIVRDKVVEHSQIRMEDDKLVDRYEVTSLGRWSAQNSGARPKDELVTDPLVALHEHNRGKAARGAGTPRPEARPKAGTRGFWFRAGWDAAGGGPG